MKAVGVERCATESMYRFCCEAETAVEGVE